jgi:ribosome recycling factor
MNADRKDEFGLIANNFNRMANELTDLVKNMEDKVEERTREIANQKDYIEAEKNKEFGEDEKFRLLDDLEKLVKDYNDQVKAIGENKEKEINTV